MTYRDAKNHFTDAARYSNDPAVQSLAMGLERLTNEIQRQLTTLKEEVEKIRKRVRVN